MPRPPARLLPRAGQCPTCSTRRLTLREWQALRGKSHDKHDKDDKKQWKHYFYKVFETSSTTLASISILGLAGFSYHRYYKRMELEKIAIGFEAGYSTPELASLARHPDAARTKGSKFTLEDHWIERNEQHIFDRIVDGTTRGHYHLIFGEKGTGKTSILLDAMRKIDGEGVAMLEAHGDLEIFRVRLGKALNYDFHEDYIGSLFSFRGPRDSTALLDIERAFNKMEKVALQRRDTVGKPLILIINGVHLLRDDEDGKDLLELIQQRAELWAASNLVTVVFNSDDYWVSERLKRQATRMLLHSVSDIPKDKAITALRNYRQRYFGEDVSSDILDQVFGKIGGRPTFISRVAGAPDMLEMANSIVEKEKKWFLSQCWILGKEMDDDVEEQQKYCAAAMVLARALVNKEKTDNDGRLPQIPLHEARQIMTRADFLKSYDQINIIAVDSSSMVRAASVPMQNAFREVCGQEGFDEHLQKTILRLDELESLQRTRELTLKDLWNNGEYRLSAAEDGQSGFKGWLLKVFFPTKK